MGPLRLRKCELKVTFTIPVQLKSDIFSWNGLVKVLLSAPLLNIKGPISKTFKLLKFDAVHAAQVVFNIIGISFKLYVLCNLYVINIHIHWAEMTSLIAL